MNNMPMIQLSSRYDLIVIGLGMSSGPAIGLLLDRHPNLRVLVLERGKEWDPDSLGDTPGEPVADPTLLIECGHETRRATPWWETARAGGSSTMWYGQLSRFLEEDFAPSTHLESGRLRWPFDLEVLSSFYSRVEKDLSPYGPPRFGDARTECGQYRTRPFLSHLERSLLDHLGRAGWYPYVGATCLGGPEWRRNPIDPLTLDRVDPRHREKVRPTYYARNYREMQRCGWDVRFEAEVYSLKAGRSGIEAVCFRGADGRKTTAKANMVLLGCGPLRTVPLLATLPRPRPSLGAGFTFTTQGVAYIQTTLRRSTNPVDWRAGTFASICSRQLDRHLNGGRGKIAIYDALAFDGVKKTQNRLSASRRDTAEIMRIASTHYLLKLSFKGESIPWQGKQIRSNDNPVTRISLRYHPHPQDVELTQLLPGLFQCVADALPGGTVLSVAAPDDANWLSAHQHGGATFRTNSDGVVGEFGEHLDHPGLFVIDSSSFPSSGATNTSLTLMANALRCADNISQRYEQSLGGY